PPPFLPEPCVVRERLRLGAPSRTMLGPAGRRPAILLASPQRREAVTREEYDETLRSRVPGPSGPERASARDARALSIDDRRRGRQDSPSGRLGPAPARPLDRESAQGALSAHEHRVRQADAR